MIRFTESEEKSLSSAMDLVVLLKKLDLLSSRSIWRWRYDWTNSLRKNYV